MSTTKI